MPNFRIDDLQAGMTLADDVSDPRGRPLLRAGVELTDKHIKVFKTWGVVQVNIIGEGTTTVLQDVIDAHPELLEEAREKADDLFQHVDREHPVFQELIPKSVQFYVRARANEL